MSALFTRAYGREITQAYNHAYSFSKKLEQQFQNFQPAQSNAILASTLGPSNTHIFGGEGRDWEHPFAKQVEMLRAISFDEKYLRHATNSIPTTGLSGSYVGVGRWVVHCGNTEGAIALVN